ncbi:MAG: helix-turn-helix transcriptional regulator [Candidatus Methylacidiphilales bacterium]
MKNKLLKKVSKNPKLLILTEIKRSQGLSVAELCDRIGLSYMGVKQHCIALEKDGYLDTWRRPKGMGRPEKAYRLTDNAQDFFPTEYSSLTTEILQSVNEVYGPNAAEKILHNIYQRDTDSLKSKVQADTVEARSRKLAQIREERGYMSEFVTDPDTHTFRIVEYNSPILICLDLFPQLRDLESRMFETLLKAPVRREEERVSGLFHCTFHIG